MLGALLMFILFIYSLISTFISYTLITSQFKKRTICRRPLPSFMIYGITLFAFIIAFNEYKEVSLEFIIVTLILSCLIILSFIDYVTFELPNVYIVALGILGIIYHLILGSFSLSSLIVGFFAASLPLLLLGLLSGGNMGGGDIKLAAACGLWLGAPMVLLGLFLSTLIASLWYIFLLLIGHKHLKSTIAFGPFLAIGFSVAYFYGWQILNGYFKIMGIT